MSFERNVPVASKTFLTYLFCSPNSWGIESLNHLDLGCGGNPRNPFAAERVYGVDLIPDLDFSSFGVEYRKLNQDFVLPFDDETLDSISGFDFLEHLSRAYNNKFGTNEFIHFMNEVSRVLKPGGVALFVTPAFPSQMAFSDPTHQNFITDETIRYFIRPESSLSAPAQDLNYGFHGNFQLLHQFWVRPPQVIFNSRVLHDDASLRYGIYHALKFNILGLLKSPLKMIRSWRAKNHLAWVLVKID
jgi:SAM-dependent methyltransferase